MPIRSQSVHSFLNGISQQPPSLRHVSQAEAQVNCWATLSDGLGWRPPTRNESQLTATNHGYASKWHTIETQGGTYTLLLYDDNIEVYNNATGASMTVNTPDGVGYLNSADPLADFEVVSIADFTFILNRTITTAMGVATTPGSVTGTVQLFSDLPASPTLNQIYKIQGDTTNEFTSYYVICSQASPAVWTETVEPGITYQLDASTMPFQLTLSGSTWTFQEVTWQDREVGDETTSPDPSFIGEELEDIFLHRNRLGFLSGPNTILSRSGDLFNYFRKTVTAVLDDDPIDRGANHPKVTKLYNAVSFNEALLVFSDKTQFVLTAEGTLTPRTADLTVTTEFEAATLGKPVGMGNNVFFPVEAGSWSSVREYFVEPDTITNDAADITAHVPQYIPKDIHELTAGTNEDVLLVLSKDTGSENRIYAYKFYWQGTEKVQSSWSYWEFESADKVLHGQVIGGTVWMVINRGTDGCYLEKLDLRKSDPTISDVGYTVHLDRRADVTGVYTAATDITTFTLPYAVATDDDDLVILAGPTYSGQVGKGLKIQTRASTTLATVRGDYSSGDCYIGKLYTASYTLSEQFIRQQDRATGKTVATLGGRLQLKRMSVRYNDTGRFKACVTPKARACQTYTYTGKVLGDSTLLIGSAPISSGEFTFTVGTRSSTVDITLQNDKWFPAFLQSAQWSGIFTKKGVIRG